MEFHLADVRSHRGKVVIIEREKNSEFIKCYPLYSDKESENETTISIVGETEVLTSKIKNLINKKEHTSVGKGGYGQVFVYYLDNVRVAIKIFSATVREDEIMKEVKILQHLYCLHWDFS